MNKSAAFFRENNLRLDLLFLSLKKLPFAKSLLLVFLITIASNINLFAQSDEILVIRLKDGKEHIGYAMYDTATNVIVIKTVDREFFKVPLDEIDYISTYQEVKHAPLYKIPFPCEECEFACRKYPWYYMLELRGVGLRGNKIYYGGEGVLGIRLGLFSFGIGGGALRIRDTIRIPIFLHFKYTFSEKCINPYIFADVGYVFDKLVWKNKIKPSFNGIKDRKNPIMLGAGAGLDFVLNDYLDISIDAGYRYFLIATNKNAPACYDPAIVVGYDELHSVFLRVGITF